MGQIHSLESFLIKIPVTWRSPCQSIHRQPPLARGVFPYCIYFLAAGFPPLAKKSWEVQRWRSYFWFVGRFGTNFLFGGI